MTEATTVEIDVKNIGPVDEFHYELTEPGLHVIRGDQGVGKTTILRTVQVAQGADPDRNVKLKVKDGEKKGTATVGGKTLKIAKAVRQEGDIDLDDIGDLDISVVAWPNLKTADKRDAHRIAALCSLAGVKPDTKAFQALCDECRVTEEDWDEIVFDADISDDIVATVASVKRAIERRALMAEKLAKGTADEVGKLEAQVEGVDLEAETDAALLQCELDSAVESRTRLAQKIEAQRVHAERVAEAEGKLETLKAGYNGPDRETAERDQLAAKGRVDDLDQKMQALQDQISALNRDQVEATREYREAQHVRELAEQHFNSVDDLTELIEAEPEAYPTPEEIGAAETVYRAAMDALQRGERAREAKATQGRIDDLQEIAKQQGKRGRRLRDAAASTANVLTDAIKTIDGCPLTVAADDKGNARLVMKTDRSDAELFDELSDGERYRVIVETICQPGRLLPLSQSAMGELSPPTRWKIHQLAENRGCYIVTAIADEGPLRAERYGDADE